MALTNRYRIALEQSERVGVLTHKPIYLSNCLLTINARHFARNQLVHRLRDVRMRVLIDQA